MPRSPSLPVPKTLEESAEYYKKLFAECFVDTQNVMRAYMKKREEIRTKNPKWIAGTIEEGVPYADLRIALFTKQINIFITTCFHWVLYNKSLCDLEWLNNNIDKSYSSHLVVMEKQFDNCFKFAVGNCFNEMFHLMESSFRIFIKHLHPDGDELSYGKFQSIYPALFKQLGIKDREQRIKLMEFMSVIRNGIHTNWVYVPPLRSVEKKQLLRLGALILLMRKRILKKDPQPREFYYKGKNYKFIPNQSMDFRTWKLIMSFAEDMLELFDEIVNHQSVSSLPSIIE